MSSSTTNKKKREGWKARILEFINDNAKSSRSSSMKEILEFCSEKIKISETVARKLVRELVKEKKISYVTIYNNEKQYFLKNIPRLSDSVLLQRNLMVMLDIIDKHLDWMEGSYNLLKTENKASSIHSTVEMIFRNTNMLLVQQAVSNPARNSDRNVIVDYKKRIQRLYEIISAENPDEFKGMVSWFYHLIETFPHVFKGFSEPL